MIIIWNIFGCRPVKAAKFYTEPVKAVGIFTKKLHSFCRPIYRSLDPTSSSLGDVANVPDNDILALMATGF